MTDDGQYRGCVAVVTGGGRGFGKAFGEALAARGVHVVLADLDEHAGAEAAAAIRAAGGSASAVACDVADEDQVEAMVAAVAERHGGIDILINNAGLHSEAYNQPMASLGVAQVRRLFEVNVMGVVICSLAAQRLMSGRPGAVIVNISSSAAYSSGTAYGASKLAVQGTAPSNTSSSATTFYRPTRPGRNHGRSGGRRHQRPGRSMQNDEGPGH